MIKLLSLSVIVGIVGFQAMSSGLEQDVKSGDKDLHCFIEGIEKKIDPALIEYELDGYWKFKNGGASNCQLK